MFAEREFDRIADIISMFRLKLLRGGGRFSKGRGHREGTIREIRLRH